MSHLFQLRHGKNFLDNFQKFISQERSIGISIWRANYLYLNVIFRWQLLLSIQNSYPKFYFFKIFDKFEIAISDSLGLKKMVKNDF